MIRRVAAGREVVHLNLPAVVTTHLGTADGHPRRIGLQHVLDLLVDDTVGGELRRQAHADPRDTIRGIDPHVREVRRYRRVLSFGPRLGAQHIDLQPQGRLSRLHLARDLIGRYMEVSRPDLALRGQWTEQPRKRLQDGGLAGAIRAEHIGQIVKIDRHRVRTKRLEIAEPQRCDLHPRLPLPHWLLWMASGREGQPPRAGTRHRTASAARRTDTRCDPSEDLNIRAAVVRRRRCPSIGVRHCLRASGWSRHDSASGWGSPVRTASARATSYTSARM